MPQRDETSKKGKRRIEQSSTSRKKISNKPSESPGEVDATSQPTAKILVKSTHAGISFNNPVYLQVNIYRLLSIFGHAIIVPSKYYDDDQMSDPQSKLGHYLTLSNFFLEVPTNETALVEIAIAKFEESYFYTTNHLLLSHLPLPISRIKAIYLNSETQKQKILNTARVGDAGIIPPDLIHVGFPKNLAVIPADFPMPMLGHQDLSEKLRQYDQVLGAYAYVQNVPLMFASKGRLVRNYSSQYLGFVNLVLNVQGTDGDAAVRQTSFFRRLIQQNKESNDTLDWIVNRASVQANLTEQDVLDFAEFFLKSHSDQTFVEKGKIALQMLMNGIERKRAPAYILSIENVDRLYLYLFAFLYIYGNRSSEDRSNARLSIPHEIRAQNAEMVFSLLGYFYGYGLLRNYEEKFDIGDSEAATAIFSRPTNVKFGMDCYFDYCLVEAVYMHVFNGGQRIGIFHYDYLDFASLKSSSTKGITLPNRTFVETTELLGKHLFAFNNSESEKIILKASKLPETIPIISEVGIFCMNASLTPSFNLNKLLDSSTNLSNLRELATFRKKDLVDHLIFGGGAISDLEARIEMQLNTKQ